MVQLIIIWKSKNMKLVTPGTLVSTERAENSGCLFFYDFLQFT